MMNKYQKALETLEYLAVQHENTKVGKQWDEIAKEIQSCKKILQELIDKDTSKWIPCSERLPEQNERIIGTFYDDEVCRAYVGETSYFPDKLYNPYPLIAWMPLPPAYKGG